MLSLCFATTVHARAAEPEGPLQKPLATWKTDLTSFDRVAYRLALLRLVENYEKHATATVSPKHFDTIGLKVQTANAPGLATPRALVDAAIDLLRTRGFHLKDLFILDAQSHNLRSAGFLPPLSKGGSKYRGVEVKALDEGSFFRSEWYHESPLPPSSGHVVRVKMAFPNDWEAQIREGRRSYLPTPLLLGKVGWINLPVAKDSASLGVEAAVANASLWNVGNNRRFLSRKSTAPAAAIEILAVPELWERHLFSVLSLEKFQCAGGRNFHAGYVKSRKSLFLSANPIAIDAVAFEVLRVERAKLELLPRSRDQLLFQYARSLKLGDAREAKIASLP
ncbi:MAG: hypothetical protein CMI30_07940 [Opitutae bacterium]|nr:hypothetical protein [Opitutae bacterium]|tara:strand:+ start:3264 stop:4271 length:1008 start_codon:yes stop_codon:yes gene_type:complete